MSFFEIFGVNKAEVDKKNKELEQLNLNKDNALYVFPFTLQSGFVDLTESGENTVGSVVDESSYFERIWTGDDNGIAVWEDSTKIKSENNKLFKEYSIGKSFFGLSYTSNIDSKVGGSTFSEGFTAQTQEETITMFVPKSQYAISKEDTLKVFLVPQLSQRWLRIFNIKIARNTDNEEIGYWLALTTMDTSLGKTGTSIFQTIQRSAPGEGYAWPQIDDKKEVKLDDSRLRDIGVDEIQIELLGNMALAGLGLFGRRVNDATLDANQIDQPHWIFGHEVLPVQPTKVTRTSIHTPDLVPVIDMKPTLQTYFKDWKTDNQSNYDWSIRKKFEGIFDSNHTESVGNKWTKKSLTDPANRIEFKTNSKLKINGTNSPYSQQDYEFTGDMDLGTALAHNIIGNMYVNQLPMEIEESIARKVNDLPVIGKLIGLFNFGNHGWTRTKFDNKLGAGFWCMMSRMQYKFYTEAAMDVGSNNKGWLPMECFDNEKGSPIGDITGSKSTNITLKMKLSDTLNVLDTNTNSMHREYSYGLGNKFWWNDRTQVTDSDKSFAIDKFSAQIIGKGDYIITFFKDGKPIHSSKHQTNAKFIDNMRAWTNITTFSPWSTYDVDTYPTTWATIKDIPTGTASKAYKPPLVLAGKNASGSWSLSRDDYNKYNSFALGQTGKIAKTFTGTDQLLPKTNGTYLMSAEYSTGIWSGYVFYHLVVTDAHANINITVSGDLFRIAPANEVVPPTLILKTTV